MRRGITTPSSSSSSSSSSFICQSINNSSTSGMNIGGRTTSIGDRGQGGGCTCPQIRDKYYFGQLLCKIRPFSGKNRVKFGNFVNFSGKYHKNSGILIIFFSGKNHVKFRHFVNFSYIFFGQKCRAPLKLTELLRL